MKLSDIYNRLKSRIPMPEGKYKSYAILIPLIYVNGNIHLLFEIRSKSLKTQPGEICFPGGKIEENESPLESAIRETCEELNIKESNIEIIGQTDYIVTPFNLILYPFVGSIKDIDSKNINFNRDEVESIFTVPLDFFIHNTPETYFVNSKLEIPDNFPFEKIENGKVYNFRTGKYPIYFYEYDDYIIWGMTARITNNLIYILSKNNRPISK
ncbi:NUDIX hydrolase [Paramaledivibacter caminithermalis]|jgi:8-oxo-dGTP pyrophosphatase MutT (NUDIX family)|uniref:NUDIX domain-containing protein n=1 Tax=Paramaledivibacter caminithermalis (strain DSM 15212 / CIP 107654 / DViRD3) TaxID=1121301 RepID=A0A1M6SM16_PARC5|nr:CoA pyrophosphatase [Paramaledivibacter caminithermalis]SHK45680.1 NUDIX domain-containing protein [Paramaledivibacter caminithermalis DSM 15212]